jgi:hypothetical protein
MVAMRVLDAYTHPITVVTTMLNTAVVPAVSDG